MGKERFSPEIIEQIRNSVYLPDLVQKYTHLNRNNKALCPFHQERNPSFSVDAKKGLWHCFGCGRGGDTISFLMLAENLTFPNAIKLLSFDLGIRLPESDSIQKSLSDKWQEKQKKLYWVDFWEDFFKRWANNRYAELRQEIKKLPLKERRNAKDYLKELLIEDEFDGLDVLVKDRLKLFDETRRMIRNGR